MAQKFVLLHDIDVTNGTNSGAVVVRGVINAGACEDQAKQALLKVSSSDLPNITIVNRRMGV